jgi:hypothetical protein
MATGLGIIFGITRITGIIVLLDALSRRKERRHLR